MKIFYLSLICILLSLTGCAFLDKAKVNPYEGMPEVELYNEEGFISGHPLDKFKFEMTQIASHGGLNALEDIDNHTGKKFQFGGLVSNVEHRISKNGRPWGFFTLEDYDSSFEFRLFREDYMNFKNFMVDEWMICLLYTSPSPRD